MKRCANCGAVIVWIDAMWIHQTGKLFCPGGEPVGMMADPERHVSETRVNLT